MQTLPNIALEVIALFQKKQKAQVKNKSMMPLYGVEVIGKQWTFVTMEGADYCISPLYDSTTISILRKFREILETRLLKFVG